MFITLYGMEASTHFTHSVKSVGGKTHERMDFPLEMTVQGWSQIGRAQIPQRHPGLPFLALGSSFPSSIFPKQIRFLPERDYRPWWGLALFLCLCDQWIKTWGEALPLGWCPMWRAQHKLPQPLQQLVSDLEHESMFCLQSWKAGMFY